MASLLQRLGQGLGQGLQMAGKIGLEEQREKRLAAIRENAAQTAAARADKRDVKLRKWSQADAQTAGIAQGQRDISLRELKLQDDQIASDRLDARSQTKITSQETIAANKLAAQDKRDASKLEDPYADEINAAEDKQFGIDAVKAQNKWEFGSETDFDTFGGNKERAAVFAESAQALARKNGTLEEFKAEFAAKDWGYIQELAREKQGKQPEKTAAAPPVKQQAQDNYTLEQIFNDVGRSGKAVNKTTIANGILKDPKFTDKVKREAKAFLKGDKKPVPKTTIKPKADKFTDKENWWLEPNLPVDAAEQMTPKQWDDRVRNINTEQAKAKTVKAKAKTVKAESKAKALEEVDTLFDTLSRSDQQKWLRANYQYLTIGQRKELNARRKKNDI